MALSTATATVNLADDDAGTGPGSESTWITETGGPEAMGVAAAPGGLVVAAGVAAAPGGLVAAPGGLATGGGGSGLVAAAVAAPGGLAIGGGGTGLVAAALAAPGGLAIGGGPGWVAAVSARPRLHGGLASWLPLLCPAGPGGIPVPFAGGGPPAALLAAAPGAVVAIAGGGLDKKDQRLAIKAFSAAGSPPGPGPGPGGGPAEGGASSPGAAIAIIANTGKAKRMASRHRRGPCRGLRELSVKTAAADMTPLQQHMT